MNFVAENACPASEDPGQNEVVTLVMIKGRQIDGQRKQKQS